ncbi:hypothetical protein NPIL_243261 [Nephila pilipes]|uniref:Uncharacterized protein n=1 Tax=Nephila pilipes TaxID=299642 RepID=A0A8X6TGY6_NEPPI|nr:hypothetical protein NPIL_243261 [Nephila pilipes]
MKIRLEFHLNVEAAHIGRSCHSVIESNETDIQGIEAKNLLLIFVREQEELGGINGCSLCAERRSKGICCSSLHGNMDHVGYHVEIRWSP